MFLKSGILITSCAICVICACDLKVYAVYTTMEAAICEQDLSPRQDSPRGQQSILFVLYLGAADHYFPRWEDSFSHIPSFC